MSAWPVVSVTAFVTTADVIWAGRDGKPRCAHHPYICLVPARSVWIDVDGHVCAQCMRDRRAPSSIEGEQP